MLISAALRFLHCVDSCAQPFGPCVNAFALCRGDGEDGRLRVELCDFRAEGVFVEIEYAHGVDFVQDDGFACLEHARVFQGLVIAFGDRENHDFGAFAQIEVGGAYKVSHVFDDNEIEVVQIEGIYGPANHVAFKMAGAACVNLHGRNPLCADALGIHVACDVAFDYGDVEFIAQCLDCRKDGRGFSRSGACEQVEDEDLLLFEQVSVFLGDSIVFIKNWLFQIYLHKSLLLQFLQV